MCRKDKLSSLVYKAQTGDKEAMSQVITRLTPLIKKYSKRLGYNDASSDLTVWVINAVKSYKPNYISEISNILSAGEKDGKV